MRHVVVLIDGLSVLDVQGVPSGRTAFSHKHSIGACLWHFNRGGDSVRCVFGVHGRGLRNTSRSGIIYEISSSSDQTGSQTRISALGEAVVQGENVVLLRLDPEVVL